MLHTNYITQCAGQIYCFDYAIQPNGDVYYENLQVLRADYWERVNRIPKGFVAHLEELFSDEIDAAKDNYAAENNDYNYLKIHE